MGTGQLSPQGLHGATGPQGRATSSHGRKVLTKAKQAGCGSAAGRESESPGLFCCQVISGSIKGCLQDAKSISSPIWMPSTLSHFLPNRYQPCSSLLKNCSLQPAATLQIFLQQVKKARNASPHPFPPSLPGGILCAPPQQQGCRCRKKSLLSNITLHSEFSLWVCKCPGGC